jgi:hypothetical protein
MKSSAKSIARGLHPRSRLQRVVYENGLCLSLVGLFLLTLMGQISFGCTAHNQERLEWGLRALSLGDYLTSGHFLEALFENWESEFLQMGLFVWMSVRLVQKGSAESNPLDEEPESAEDPRNHQASPSTRSRSPSECMQWEVGVGGVSHELTKCLAWWGLGGRLSASASGCGDLRPGAARAAAGVATRCWCATCPDEPSPANAGQLSARDAR